MLDLLKQFHSFKEISFYLLRSLFRSVWYDDQAFVAVVRKKKTVTDKQFDTGAQFSHQV